MDTSHWTNRIDSVTASYLTVFGHLTAEQIDLKPDDRTWSIGQIIDHVITVNESYYPLIESLQNGTFKVPFSGKIDFIVNFVGKQILEAVKPDRLKRTKTFPIWEPRAEYIGTDIIKRFEQHQSELKAVITGCRRLVEKGTVISSPANRFVVYKLATAFDIIIAHEERHLEQAKLVFA
jgi:hypothetical protein